MFVTRLSSSGNSLVYSTYLGGSRGNDFCYCVALDGSGAVYVTGQAASNNFPTLNPFQGTHHGQVDVFVTKLVVLPHICGDADASGEVDIDDVLYLIAYIFSGGPPPDPYQSGDADCSGDVDIDDVVYLVNYIFSGGDAPCDTSADGVPNC